MTPKELIALEAVAHMPKPSHNMFATAVLRALDAAGYTIVPCEPTQEMIAAGEMPPHGGKGIPFFDDHRTDNHVAIYKAMIAATQI